jgi:hypothetical protein
VLIAGFLGVARAGVRHRVAEVAHLSLVVLVHPGHDLDERRLAGAVLPDEGVHLAGQQVEGHVLESDDTDEPLRDVAYLEEAGRLVRHVMALPMVRCWAMRHCDVDEASRGG